MVSSFPVLSETSSLHPLLLSTAAAALILNSTISVLRFVVNVCSKPACQLLTVCFAVCCKRLFKLLQLTKLCMWATTSVVYLCTSLTLKVLLPVSNIHSNMHITIGLLSDIIHTCHSRQSHLVPNKTTDYTIYTVNHKKMAAHLWS